MKVLAYLIVALCLFELSMTAPAKAKKAKKPDLAGAAKKGKKAQKSKKLSMGYGYQMPPRKELREYEPEYNVPKEKDIKEYPEYPRAKVEERRYDDKYPSIERYPDVYKIKQEKEYSDRDRYGQMEKKKEREYPEKYPEVYKIKQEKEYTERKGYEQMKKKKRTRIP